LEATFYNITTSRSDLEELQSKFGPQWPRLHRQLQHAPSPAPCGPLTPGSSLQIPSVQQQLEALRDVSRSSIATDLE
ncbi:hypothetical protein N305_05520, partial [Manacus vitellinus]